ncbi:MAG: GyrI-like domain-containing protein [Actinobacteria bacterium]|nr:GyrI-like domain-containing protein [Actinomycetota bacterium]
MDRGITIKEQNYQPIFCAQFKATLSDIGENLGSAYSNLFSSLSKRGEFPSGPPFALYFTKEFEEKDLNVEACVPTAGILPDDGDLKGKGLSGGLSASIVHMGAYETIGESYKELITWISSHGYNFKGEWREIYLIGPSDVSDPGDYRTEIVCQISKSGT